MNGLAITDESAFQPTQATGPAATGGIDIDDEGAFQPAQPRQKRGKVESFFRGVKQGATLGFGDEISGALESVFSSKTYRQARDEARSADKQAQEQNPWTYGAGGLAGGAATAFVPGLGLAKGAQAALGAGKLLAGAGAAAKTGAALGALGGLGSSEAELGNGELGRAALDTAVGAGLGAAGGAAGTVASNVLGRGAAAKASSYASEKLRAAQGEGKEAFEKAAEKLGSLVAKDKPAALAAVKSSEAAAGEAKRSVVDDALGVLRGPGAQNSTKAKVLGANSGLKKVRGVLEADRELRAGIMGGPDAGLDVVAKRLEKYGGKLDDVYDTAQGMTLGAKVDKVAERLAAIEREYGSTADKPLAAQVRKEIEAFQEQYGGGGGAVTPSSLKAPALTKVQGDNYGATNIATPANKAVGNTSPDRISLQQLRAEYRGWQDIANASVKMTGEKSPRAQVAEEMANAMRSVLHEEIERVAAKTPSMGPLLKSLKIANEKVSAYKGIQRILDEQQRRLNSGAQTMTGQLGGIKDQIKAGVAGLADRAIAPVAAGVTRFGQRAQAATGAPGRAASNVLPFARQGATAGAPQAPAGAAAALRQALGLGPEDDEDQALAAR